MNHTIDYYNLSSFLTEEQKLVRSSIRAWVDNYVKPHINEHYKNGAIPKEWIQALADMGCFGLIIPEKYGGIGADFITYGLMMQELERGDTALRVMSSIQTSMVMYAIWQYGSESQKTKYLPKLSSGKMLGAFGLTEPDHGSNPSAMHSYFRRKEDDIILNGAKLWIGNATTADVAIVWARNENGAIQGIIVETDGLESFTCADIPHKWAFKASVTGELVFSDTRIPATQILEGSTSIKDAYHCLNIGRYAIAWGSVGIAIDCYETALTYAKQRNQFGKCIASYQLIQKKLAEMITEITKAQLICHQLGRLMDDGTATYEQISMAKRDNVAMAKFVASEARQILGGMGITGDYPVMRHLANLEVLITYQGSHEIHLLITGKSITGVKAY